MPLGLFLVRIEASRASRFKEIKPGAFLPAGAVSDKVADGQDYRGRALGGHGGWRVIE